MGRNKTRQAPPPPGRGAGLHDIGDAIANALPADMGGEVDMGGSEEAGEVSPVDQLPAESDEDSRPGSAPAEDAPASEGETPAEPESGDEEPYVLESLTDFAQALEMPVEDLLQLKHRFKADGEEREATLHDLVRGFQQETNFTQKTQALAEERRQLQANEEARQQAFIQGHQAVAQQFQMLEGQIRQAYESPEMRQMLADGDNAGYLVAKHQLDGKLKELEQRRQHMGQQFEQERQAMLRDSLTRESAILRELVPEWGDDHKAKVREFVLKQNLPPQALAAIDYSAQLTHMMYRMAMLETEKATSGAKQKRAKQIAKAAKAKGLPPVARPGARMSASARTAKARQVKALRQNLKKTGKVKDAAELLSQTLKF